MRILEKEEIHFLQLLREEKFYLVRITIRRYRFILSLSETRIRFIDWVFFFSKRVNFYKQFLFFLSFFCTPPWNSNEIPSPASLSIILIFGRAKRPPNWSLYFTAPCSRGMRAAHDWRFTREAVIKPVFYIGAGTNAHFPATRRRLVVVVVVGLSN